jgi:cobaltochelatase CobT
MAYLIILLFIGLIVLSAFLEWQRKSPVKDLPEGTPYSIYTTEFDRAVAAQDLSENLASFSPDYSKGFVSRDRLKWARAVANAEEIFGNLIDSVPLTLPLPDPIKKIAVTLLIDQSGSMKGEPMENAAAALRKLSEVLAYNEIASEVIGFSTAGWHGGYVRKKWIENGKPPRPGRLCALLHIIYKSFDEAALSENAWREMLNPDILRENVDGEAIEFAEKRLLDRPEQRKFLIVISDGAPVDDSTLMQNGRSILWRHVQQVVDRIETERRISLAAIGINHRVEGLFGTSISTENLSDLPQVLSDFVKRLLAA